MKKLLIGAFVGGLLLFIWQTLSWMVFDLHAKAHSYSERQDAIMNVLNTELPGEGSYMLPMAKPGTPMSEHEVFMKENEGKPWATIIYRKSLKVDMAMNIVRGFVVNLVLMALFCWMISKFAIPKMGTVFTASIIAGLIVFLNGIYTGHIWYPTFDLMAHFADAIVGWGLAGIWLGWWYSKK